MALRDNTNVKPEDSREDKKQEGQDLIITPKMMNPPGKASQ
jgi:hypothetical protein